MPKVLVVIAPGAEEIETITIADVLVRAGCQVTMAGAEATVTNGSRDLPMACDCLLDEVLDQVFDLVYLPGGLGSADYCSQDPRIQSLASRQLAADRYLAIICACPIALIPAGLAQGRHLTSYPSMRERLEAAGAQWHDQPVVIDGKLVTSQAPGTAMQMALTLAGLLTSADHVPELAAAMLVSELPSLQEISS